MIEFHGAIYLCSNCLEEIANLAGYLSPEQVEKLQGEMKLLSDEVYALKVKENGLEVAIGGLVAAGLRSPDVDSDLPHVRIADSDTSTDSPGEGNQLGEGEGTAPEPSDDEGVAELHPDDGGDEPTPFSINLG